LSFISVLLFLFTPYIYITLDNVKCISYRHFPKMLGKIYIRSNIKLNIVVSVTAKVIKVKYHVNTANRFNRFIQKKRFNRTIHSRIGHQYNKDNLGALSAFNQPAGFIKVQLIYVTKHIKLSDKPRLSAVVSLNCNFCIGKCHSRRNLGTKDVDIHSSNHLSIHPSHPTIHLQEARVSSSLTGWRRE